MLMRLAAAIEAGGDGDAPGWIDARQGAAIRKLLDAQSGQRAGVVDGSNAFRAVINFALQHGLDGMEFLRCWNEGDFEACRKEWPEAPAACYIGADPSLTVPLLTKCPVCGEKQFTSPSGISCPNGHGGADGYDA